MPQLAKGGKWVYGWVIVGPDSRLPIPPAAWRKYGFQAGGEALLLAGSRRAASAWPMQHGSRRIWRRAYGAAPGSTRKAGRRCL